MNSTLSSCKRTLLFNFLSFFFRTHSRNKCEGTKVVLLNSYSKIGVLTSYLLKKTNIFSEICLYEPRHATTIEGTIADLNNINTPALATYYTGKNSLIQALQHANIVVMLEKYATLCLEPKDVCKKKCKTPLEMADEILNKVFIVNAEYCAKIAETYATVCPTALLVDAIKPVNSTLPLVCRVAERTNANVNALRILGFTTMDVVAANLMWAKSQKTKLESANIPVIGGTTSYTVIPLFSQGKGPEKKKKDQKNEDQKTADSKKGQKEVEDQKIDEEELEKETELAKELTTELRKKNEMLLLDPNAPLATAAAIAKFVISLGTALRGHEMKEYAYVKSNLIPDVPYLAGPIQLGPAGVQKIIPIPKLSDHERILLESAPYYLLADIKRGEDYAENYLEEDKC